MTADAAAPDPGPSWQGVEGELRSRAAGWWDRVRRLVPELAALDGVPQPAQYHGEGDVAVHTRLAVEACPRDCDSDLLWAALLHDIGKPETTRTDGEVVTAHAHARAGVGIAEVVLTRLGFPPHRRERVVWAVRHHTFHLSWNLARPEDASRRHRRFAAQPDFPLLLELLRVDSEASHGHPRAMAAHELYTALYRQVRSDPGEGPANGPEGN